MTDEVDIDAVREYLLDLQGTLCEALERTDSHRHFQRDERPGERGGSAQPWTLADGAVFERAAVNFSHTAGERLPAAGWARWPELAGGRFDAVSVSLIAHPANPYVPTVHANLRLISARGEDGQGRWWFGGGFDLTPCYGFEEDALHWHRTARAACEGFGVELYAHCKKRCDEYFHLPHRGETRGVGGLFFDDLGSGAAGGEDLGGFERCFAFARSVGDHFLPAYLPIVERRKATAYGERQRRFQLYRRGRYVEFNLLYDRGTRFGPQSESRVESVLASLPPLAGWRYDWRPEPGSPEGRLTTDFLRPRDWLSDT